MSGKNFINVVTGHRLKSMLPRSTSVDVRHVCKKRRRQAQTKVYATFYFFFFSSTGWLRSTSKSSFSFSRFDPNRISVLDTNLGEWVFAGL